MRCPRVAENQLSCGTPWKIPCLSVRRQAGHILVVALIFITGCRALRFTVPGMTRRTRPLFIASIIWKAHAAWEWLVQIQIPEANIRADLLLMWPVLAVVSGWTLFRAF